MKKKTKKRLDSIAAQLPVMYETANAHQRIKGSSLLERGITEHKGEEISPYKYYSFWKTIQVPVNHSRRLKRAFQRNGEKGVLRYIKQLNNTQAK